MFEWFIDIGWIWIHTYHLNFILFQFYKWTLYISHRDGFFWMSFVLKPQLLLTFQWRICLVFLQTEQPLSIETLNNFRFAVWSMYAFSMSLDLLCVLIFHCVCVFGTNGINVHFSAACRCRYTTLSVLISKLAGMI